MEQEQEQRRNDGALPERVVQSLISRVTSRRGFMGRAAGVGAGLAGALLIPGMRGASAAGVEPITPQHGDPQIDEGLLGELTRTIQRSPAFAQIQSEIIGGSTIPNYTPILPDVTVDPFGIAPRVESHDESDPTAPTVLSFSLTPTERSSDEELGLWVARRARFVMAGGSVAAAVTHEADLVRLTRIVEALDGFTLPDDLATETDLGQHLTDIVAMRRLRIEQQRRAAQLERRQGPSPEDKLSAVRSLGNGVYQRTAAGHWGYGTCCGQPWTCEDGFWSEVCPTTQQYQSCYDQCTGAGNDPIGCAIVCGQCWDVWTCTDCRCFYWIHPEDEWDLNNNCYWWTCGL